MVNVKKLLIFNIYPESLNKLICFMIKIWESSIRGIQVVSVEPSMLSMGTANWDTTKKASLSENGASSKTMALSGNPRAFGMAVT